MSKNFTTIPMSLKEANEFVTEHHSHNKKVQGHKFSIGVLHENNLVGVAICGRPISATLDDKKTLELLRSCVLDNAPRNTNSYLYGRCWRVADAKRKNINFIGIEINKDNFDIAENRIINTTN